MEPGPITSRFRDNAFREYLKHIDREGSVHQATYRQMEARLQKEGPAVPFTLGPEAVVSKVIHALESRRPRARYHVTFPTRLFAVLKRLLPDRALDELLGRVG